MTNTGFIRLPNKDLFSVNDNEEEEEISYKKLAVIPMGFQQFPSNDTLPLSVENRP
jgi:hypothetical protein